MLQVIYVYMCVCLIYGDAYDNIWTPVHGQRLASLTHPQNPKKPPEQREYEAGDAWQPRYVHPGVSGLRYFSPDEVARLLHFPAGFAFPPGKRAWAWEGWCLLWGYVRHSIHTPTPTPTHHTHSSVRPQMLRAAGQLDPRGRGHPAAALPAATCRGSIIVINNSGSSGGR